LALWVGIEPSHAAPSSPHPVLIHRLADRWSGAPYGHARLSVVFAIALTAMPVCWQHHACH